MGTENPVAIRLPGIELNEIKLEQRFNADEEEEKEDAIAYDKSIVSPNSLRSLSPIGSVNYAPNMNTPEMTFKAEDLN